MNKKAILFNLDEWIVYEVVDGDVDVAVPMEEQKRILHLINHYGSLTNIPDDETVKATPIRDSLNEKDAVELDPDTKWTLSLNKLRSTIIPHLPRPGKQ
jgi:hypothetical protein